MAKPIARTIVLIALLLVLSIQIFFTTNQDVSALASSRGIENNLEMWTLGYMKVFFKFEYFSYIPFLSLILMAFSFVFWERLLLSYKIALIVLIMVLFLIGKFGFFNFRYSFSIVPILIALPSCFYLLLKDKFHGKVSLFLRVFLLTIMFFLSISSFFLNIDKIKNRFYQIYNQRFSTVVTDTIDEMRLIYGNEPLSKFMSIRFKYSHYYFLDESYIYDYDSYIRYMKSEKNSYKRSFFYYLNSSDIGYVVAPNSIVSKKTLNNDVYEVISNCADLIYKNKYSSIYKMKLKCEL